MRVSLTHRYDAPPRAVWELATDLDFLAEISPFPMEGLPKGRIHRGQVIETRVRAFGAARPYRMEVAEMDEGEMRFASRESGMGARRWDHTLRVVPDGEGARIEESIEVEAGALTPLYALMARRLYARRHAPRLARLSGMETA